MDGVSDTQHIYRSKCTKCLTQFDFVCRSLGKDVFGQAGKYSVIMKKVPLPIVEFSECQRELQASRLGDKFRLDTSFICAGGVEGKCHIFYIVFYYAFHLADNFSLF